MSRAHPPSLNTRTFARGCRYDVIDTNADAILAAQPGDPHALFVKALYAHAANDLAGAREHAGRLRASSPEAASALDRATNDVVLAWSEYGSMRTTAEVVALAGSWEPQSLAIVIFGEPPHSTMPWYRAIVICAELCVRASPSGQARAIFCHRPREHIRSLTQPLLPMCGCRGLLSPVP